MFTPTLNTLYEQAAKKKKSQKEEEKTQKPNNSDFIFSLCKSKMSCFYYSFKAKVYTSMSKAVIEKQ